MRIPTLAAIALTAACCGALNAQTTKLRVGRTVRVSAPAQGVYARTLTLLAATPDTLVLGRVVPRSGHSDTTRLRVAVSNVRRLEVPTRQTDIARGGAIGAGAGAVVGFLLVKMGECRGGGAWQINCWERGHAGQGALIGGGFGLAVGALVGALHSRQTWVSVPAEGLRGLQLGVAPQAGGSLGVGLALSF